jgi:hypothetical protein
MQFIKRYNAFINESYVSPLVQMTNNSLLKVIGDTETIETAQGVLIPRDEYEKLDDADKASLDKSLGVSVTFVEDIITVLKQKVAKPQPEPEPVYEPIQQVKKRRKRSDDSIKGVPMYFLRWTNSAENDLVRNFSGHMQAWFDTKEEAVSDAKEHGGSVKYDPINMEWNSDAEWGLSAYGFSINDEKSFHEAVANIIDIKDFHHDLRSQDLYLFRSYNYELGQGFDGEDCFRDGEIISHIPDTITYEKIKEIITKYV